MLNILNKKEIKSLKLEKEVESLRKANKIQKYLLKDWEKSYKESLFEINKLKKELKEYNPKLKPRTKKISKSDIKKSKNYIDLMNILIEKLV